MQYLAINVQDLNLRYADSVNNAAPMLLIGGIGMSLEASEALSQTLAENGFRCVSLELPSTSGIKPWRLRDYADLLAQWLTAIGMDKVVVMGISWGGALAQEFTRRHPQRLSHLVLASTTPGMVMLPGTAKALSSFLQPKLYRQKKSSVATAAPALTLDLPTMGWQMLAAAGWTSIHWLHRITQPVLIINGSQDQLVRPINAKILLRRVRHGRLAIIEGGGHLCAYTHASQIADLIVNFVRSDACVDDVRTTQ